MTVEYRYDEDGTIAFIPPSLDSVKNLVNNFETLEAYSLPMDIGFAFLDLKDQPKKETGREVACSRMKSTTVHVIGIVKERILLKSGEKVVTKVIGTFPGMQIPTISFEYIDTSTKPRVLIGGSCFFVNEREKARQNGRKK